MKKFVLVLSVFVLSIGFISGQVLEQQGVENTVSFSFGVPYGIANDTHREGFHFYGLIDTLQVRADISKFTIEGMLSWGALTDWKYDKGNLLDVDDDRWVFSGMTFGITPVTPFTYTNNWQNGGSQTNGYDGYYVNFLFHATQNIDLGMGTCLNWEIGPSPSNGALLWEPLAHVAQGGLRVATPGKADVAGYVEYANDYAGSALAARFKNDVIEVGVAIPSGASTNAFLTNFALEITPLDWLSIGAAWKGCWRGDSDLYTGLTVNLKNSFVIDAYLAVDNIGGDNDNGMWGTGAGVLIELPNLDFYLRPEFGFTFWEKSNYSFAWYTGIRAEFSVSRLKFGLWTSFASGSKDKDWANYKATEDYFGGFVFDLRPDIAFEIDDYNTLSIMFDFQYRNAYNNKKYNDWAAALYWTYKM